METWKGIPYTKQVLTPPFEGQSLLALMQWPVSLGRKKWLWQITLTVPLKQLFSLLWFNPTSSWITHSPSFAVPFPLGWGGESEKRVELMGWGGKNKENDYWALVISCNQNNLSGIARHPDPVLIQSLKEKAPIEPVVKLIASSFTPFSCYNKTNTEWFFSESSHIMLVRKRWEKIFSHPAKPRSYWNVVLNVKRSTWLFLPG